MIPLEGARRSDKVKETNYFTCNQTCIRQENRLQRKAGKRLEQPL